MFCSPACEKGHKEELNAKKAGKSTSKGKSGGIANASESKLADLAVYRPIRDHYMAEHPMCEVEGCNNVADSLHHKKGRVGYADEWARMNGVKLLWDVRFFMAACIMPCHRKISDDTKWAREKGYIL